MNDVSTADREKAISAARGATTPGTVFGKDRAKIVDALIADGWRPGGAPVAPTREALAEALMGIYDHGTQPNAFREADILLALFERREDVQAEALRDAADDIMENGGEFLTPSDVEAWLTARAAELRKAAQA